MEFLNIFANPVKFESTCFLCFKQNEDNTCVSQKLIICDEFRTANTTLTGIMKYLFPNHEILFDQACGACSSFLLQAFIKLKKHNILRNIICNLTKMLSDEIRNAKDRICSSKLYMTLNSPMSNSIPANCTLKDFEIKNDECVEDKNDLTSNKNVPEISICKKCDMKFDNKSLLYKHEKMVHKNTNAAVICEICGKDCKKPGTLKAHLNCHKVKPCPYCQKTLKTHCHYKIHVRNHESNFKKGRRNKSQYSCNICPYKSFNKHSLDAHINKVHLQLRPYVCEICDKGFYKKSNLTEHLNTHTTVKNLTCELCGDHFSTNKCLNDHLKLHTGDRPFQCEICHLTFITSGRKSDHFKRKHMEKTINCIVCDKKFSLKKELNAHVKKVHGQNSNDIVSKLETEKSIMAVKFRK